ncbi:hypothetical protein [Modestobacter lapidis]|nr:hypothetical protein [Modestobacter lapidis]
MSLRERVTAKPPRNAAPPVDPQVTAAGIGRSGNVRAALVNGIAALLIGITGYASGAAINEQSAGHRAEEQSITWQQEQEEERESTVCADVYLAARARANNDPQGVRFLFQTGQEGSLFSEEQRETCPAHEDVLDAIRPAPEGG